MSNLYGFFGSKLYRMSGTEGTPSPILPFSSTIHTVEQRCDKTVTEVVQVNTMDFYSEESNDSLYKKLLAFITDNQLTGIDTLYYALKIAVEYTLYDQNKKYLDGGVRYVQVEGDHVYVCMPIVPETNALNYRHAIDVKDEILITKIMGGSYGIMDPVPTGVTIQINSLKILATVADSTKSYTLQNIGPSMQVTTFPKTSDTVSYIENNSVCLFDSTTYGLNGLSFPEQTLSYVPGAIVLRINILLNNFCEVYDDSVIWELISKNSGSSGCGCDGNSCVCPPCYGGCSPFDPVVNRKPCPGNRQYPPARPPVGGNGSGSTSGNGGCCCDPDSGATEEEGEEITPGTGWDPNGSITGDDKPCHPEHHHPHHEHHDHKPEPHKPPCEPPHRPHHPEKPPVVEDPGEPHFDWIYSPDYDKELSPSTQRYLVVADEYPTADFDASCMVHYSEVTPYVPDIIIGQYVKKGTAVYF